MAMTGVNIGNGIFFRVGEDVFKKVDPTAITGFIRLQKFTRL